MNDPSPVGMKARITAGLEHSTARHLAGGGFGIPVEGCPLCDAMRDFCARCRRAVRPHWCDFRHGDDPSYDTPTDLPCPCPGPHYH